MRYFTTLHGDVKQVNTLLERYANVINAIADRIEKAGYNFIISLKKDASIRRTENAEYYIFFSIDGKTNETTNIGIRMALTCDAFKTGKLSSDPIKINKNCSWSPKPLFI